MRPSGAWRPFAMSCASAGFALPANSASVSLVRLSVVLITAALRARSTDPACGRVPSGAPGLKNWLGWKDSNLRMAGSKPAALPLGDTPASVALTIRTKPTRMGGGRASYAASPTPRVPEELVERGAVEAPRHEAPPAGGHPPREPLRLGDALDGREAPRARAGSPRARSARGAPWPHPSSRRRGPNPGGCVCEL